MTDSSIKEHLQMAFDELQSILPEEFQERFKEKAFISGGAIYSLYNHKDVNDYDFFIKDKKFADELYTYFKGITKPFKRIRNGKYNGHNILVTKYAISIGRKFQIVIKYTGQPQEVIEQFDFKHNMFAYENGKIEAYTEWEYLNDSTLHFNTGRVRDISGTIMRIPKMVMKGFKINKSEVAKMLKKLNENGFDEREQEIINSYTTY